MVLFLLGLGGLSVATLVIACRGGRGPGDPPASHARIDPAGFFVLPEPRGVLPRHPAQRRQSRGPRRSRPAAARIAAVIQTARESRTARWMSSAVGGRPSPSGGRSSIRLP
ncbi:MAG: hypothetical protein JWP62_1159 [Blastococcus sp.]|nr:hypothetical protein [Blastococcus sp.]